LMMSLWDALRMNMMISYQELVRTFLNNESKMEDAVNFGINSVWHHIRDRADCALGIFQSS
ncbi:hypothetical protein QCN08_23440, partial [Enterobacter roggenkampii]|uniref:hypothetical protein n=1 Tax=Enterobacter roggenkampii TaxID=1812935 RepID=UPI002FD87C10